jgi:uncharacterized membrane protein YhaH (DUF805 family)
MRTLFTTNGFKIMVYYLKALRHYADFNGRARRKELWHFNAVHILVLIMLFVIGKANGFPFVALIYLLASLPPTFALLVRRAHDIGKSGRFIISPAAKNQLGYTDSEIGDNQYGPNPKGVNC